MLALTEALVPNEKRTARRVDSAGSYHRIRAARSFLFVPGDRPERFAKAAASGADLLILDLEDAVTPADKAGARDAVVAYLRGGGTALVRVNGARSPWHSDDLEAVAGLATGLVVPKSESAKDWWGTSDVPVVPLVETARGVLDARDVLADPQAVRPALGSIDLGAELGISPDDGEALRHVRSSLVLAASAAGVGSPIDGVTAAFRDDAALVRDLEQARRLGFGAKLCIHPVQVETVHRVLAFTPEDIAWAERIVALDGSAVSIDGQMVDAAVVARAAHILAAARNQPIEPERTSVS
ncbi:MAG: CoA ester lyase [Acidimicrobiales bacterium]